MKISIDTTSTSALVLMSTSAPLVLPDTTLPISLLRHSEKGAIGARAAGWRQGVGRSLGRRRRLDPIAPARLGAIQRLVGALHDFGERVAGADRSDAER